MKRWEYKTIKSKVTSTLEELDEYLNEIGEEGWECYSVYGGPTIIDLSLIEYNHALFFKREIKEDKR
jgi:hypothetical protein